VQKHFESKNFHRMSKESEVAGDHNPDPIRAEAQRLLDEIKQFRTQAEEQFKAAEASRKNADSEGLFAINAKRTCEEHSTAISQLKGTVEAEVTSILTNKQKFDELNSFITANRPVVEAGVKIVSESRKEIEQASGRIKEGAENGLSRLKEIEDSKKSVDAFLREAEGLRDEAILARDKINAAVSLASELAQNNDTSRDGHANVRRNQRETDELED
jgi:anion-transporting  ArsA/GET3 family ATPase